MHVFHFFPRLVIKVMCCIYTYSTLCDEETGLLNLMMSHLKYLSWGEKDVHYANQLPHPKAAE